MGPVKGMLSCSQESGPCCVLFIYSRTKIKYSCQSVVAMLSSVSLTSHVQILITNQTDYDHKLFPLT